MVELERVADDLETLAAELALQDKANDRVHSNIDALILRLAQRECDIDDMRERIARTQDAPPAGLSPAQGGEGATALGSQHPPSKHHSPAEASTRCDEAALPRAADALATVGVSGGLAALIGACVIDPCLLG